MKAYLHPWQEPETLMDQLRQSGLPLGEISQLKNGTTVVSFDEADKDLLVKKLSDYADLIHIQSSRKAIKSSIISNPDGYVCYQIDDYNGQDFTAAFEGGATNQRQRNKLLTDFAGGKTWTISGEWDMDEIDTSEYDLIVVWSDENNRVETIKSSRRNKMKLFSKFNSRRNIMSSNPYLKSVTPSMRKELAKKN